MSPLVSKHIFLFYIKIILFIKFYSYLYYKKTRIRLSVA